MEMLWSELEPILEKVKSLAAEYYRLTGKPLGITGEMGEYSAARLLGLTLVGARTPGYDATDGSRRRIQIKSRLVQNSKKLGGQKIGTIKLEHEWDIVMLVIMHKDFEPLAIYEATRQSISEALKRTESKARKRGALAISEFKRIGKQCWPEETPSN